VILGERFEPMQRDSLYMGCVTYTKRFFNGTLSREAFDRAEIAARREFQPVEQRYASLGWNSCIGSSGTVNAIDQILRTNDWSEGGITLKGLRRLRKTLIAATGLDQLSLPGLESDRAPVFAGGVAILHAAFQSLGIERMTASTGALREGLIYDLLGRIGHEDVRDQTIRRLRETYNVDPAQADRVETLALALLDQVGLGWGVDGGAARRFLTWAAQLHEIGLSISYTGYHKHGAYIVANADLPGFSRDDQELLAALIRSHRRKLRVDDFRGLPIIRHKAALRLCVLLRLAVTLSRSRNTDPLPPLTLTVKKERFKLTFPRGWLESHPLTLADMEEEATRLEAAGQHLVSES
jgi:exopolyphosphatase/guanosine-5'-triphosphate,3'-diphosphate pyrophosphatase